MANNAQYQRGEHELDETTSAQFLEQIITLWEGLAAELTRIIGDGGFRILFTRSTSLAKEKFSWLEKCPFQLQDDSPSRYFKVCFAGRDIGEMRTANALIVSEFIETLSSLVGNTLTNNLLGSAWEHHRPTSADEVSHQSH